MFAKLKYLSLGLGRNVLLLGFVSLFTDISSEMLYPIVPLFLTLTLNTPMSVVGLIEGIAEGTASLLKIVSGWWSDRAGRRQPFVVWGYSLSAISKPLLALATTWHFVLASRLIDRVGKGIRTSPRDAMIAASCDSDARGKAFGLHRAMDTIGAFIGPILAVFLLSALNLRYRTIFIIAFIPAALGVATLAFLRRETPTPKPISGDAVPKAPISRELKKFILIYGLFALGNSSDVFLLLKAKQVGLSANGVLLTYVFYNFVYALAALPAGWLSDKLSRRALMIGGLVVFSAVYTGFAFAPNQAVIWVAFALYGFYAAATEGVSKALVADLSTPRNRGTAMGLMHMVTGLLAFVASTVAGLLWTHVHPAAPFLYGAICALAAAVLLLIGEKDMPPQGFGRKPCRPSHRV
jgi:MFS family permease